MDSQGNPESGDKYSSDNLSSGGIYIRKKSDDFDLNNSPLYDYAPTAEKGAGPFFSGATLASSQSITTTTTLDGVWGGEQVLTY